MNPRRIFSLILFVGLGLAPFNSLPRIANSDIQDESITVTLEAGPYQITKGENNLDRIQIEGFYPYGDPGNPLLPSKIFNLALPPGVDWGSLAVEVLDVKEVDLAGSFEFPAATPPTTWVEGERIEFWGDQAENILAGKNALVFQQNAYFPNAYVSLVTRSQMRKWRYATLRFTPLQYNPVTGQVRLATEVQVRLTFQQVKGDELQIMNQMNDTLMDEEAAEILYNHEQALEWYSPDPVNIQAVAPKGYAIITTNAILEGSSQLDDFVAHKQSMGYAVDVITESDYSWLTGQHPNGTPERVRQWLIDNYLSRNILYVLLVGNPDPDDPRIDFDPFGDIQMKMTWPNTGDYAEAPSDYFYADLTGNWDLDGDTYFGEYPDDFGAGGVDFAPEVYVGRIPVYTFEEGWQQTLDSILQKTIDYDNALETEWRNNALLPMSFLDDYTDSAKLAERMKSDYLSPVGYGVYTMYQQIRGSACDSVYASDEPLVDGGVRKHWSEHPYGIVAWSAHGSPGEASLYCDAGALLLNSDTPSLSNSRPAYVFEGSCYNGDPDDSTNLSYSLLKTGAVGSVGASRVSWYGGWDDPIPTTASNFDLNYFFTKRIANREPAGMALYRLKQSMSGALGWYMNLVVYNLYGDPSTSIQQAPEIQVSPAALEKKVRSGTTARGSLKVANLGGTVLEFNIVEAHTQQATAAELPAGQLHQSGRATIVTEPKTTANEKVDSLLLPQGNGGPDGIGYQYRDSYEPDGPVYQWVEIAPPAGGSGTALSGLAGVDDGYFFPLAIPFSFNFYGVEYTQLAVSTNGGLYFVDQSLSYSNAPIPGPTYSAVEALIAPFWDDLSINPPPASIYYQDLGDYFVVEYYRVSSCCVSPETGTWEVILFPNSNILFQYKDVVFGDWRDSGAEASVGIQGDALTGLGYSNFSPELTSGLAVCFAYPGQLQGCSQDLPWLSVSPASGIVQPGESTIIQVMFDARLPEELKPGRYSGSLNFSSNDPESPQLWVPVTMRIVPLDVKIDIHPGISPNRINQTSTGTVEVAVLSTRSFDSASRVHRETLTFGRTGDERSLHKTNSGAPDCWSKDVNGDQRSDLVCRFEIPNTGFRCGDTTGILKGQATDGVYIQGRDSVVITGCSTNLPANPLEDLRFDNFLFVPLVSRE